MMIEYIPRQEFNAVASLFFLASGHYLFRYLEDGREASKFVTSVDVAAAFSMKEIDSGWMPSGMVRCGSNANGPWFVYSVPGQKVKISLDNNVTITVPAPRLVLVGSGSVYWLAATTTAHFDADGFAYHAPFPNVYQDGKICWGTNTPPEAIPENVRKVWDLFWEAPFNADLAGKKSKAHSKDVRDQLRALAENKVHTYPKSDLISMNIDIERFVEKAINQ
jgi:hypothetical protein